MKKPPRARSMGLASCDICRQIVRLPDSPSIRLKCPRCGGTIHSRITHSLSRTWALLLASMILYIPANVYPVMKNTYLGAETDNTILSGVVLFLKEGDWVLALVIFTASIIVPLLKMVSLLYLLMSVRKAPHERRARQQTALYRVTELVGRWSMVDVFVIGILTALVQMGVISTVEPGIGAMAFGAVVVLTMLAALSFDPRLIWDRDLT
ncbi:paraquat-inducible protein A [Thiolapillus sp.]